MENKYFRQGYANCVAEFREYNLEHCKNMLYEMKNECEESQLVKGYELALFEIENGTLRI